MPNSSAISQHGAACEKLPPVYLLPFPFRYGVASECYFLSFLCSSLPEMHLIQCEEKKSASHPLSERELGLPQVKSSNFFIIWLFSTNARLSCYFPFSISEENASHRIALTYTIQKSSIHKLQGQICDSNRS